ncbi:hypothetical protein H0H87_006113 [Tephrocybe sp. NHM501043]|nr:hypothetical protein H0H87_006113 [Tephrocybe sp. NHM501043]
MSIPVYPQDASYRTLIVLMDGTGDSVDQDMTSVAHLKTMLIGDHTKNEKQMALYIMSIIDRFLDHSGELVLPWTDLILNLMTRKGILGKI